MTKKSSEDSLPRKDGGSDAIAAVAIVLAIVGIAIFWVSNQ